MTMQLLEAAQVVEALGRERVIAILRLRDTGHMPSVVRALLEGGVHAIELTMTMPNAVRMIADVAEAGLDVLVGAGTVMDADAAEQVIAAGARFVVSPVFDDNVLAVCRERRIAYMPGAFTPTEIHHAAMRGAHIVKVFPSSMLAPRYIRDLLGPMPALRLVPTGGVTLGDAPLWLAAGAWAVGIGADLVDPAHIARQDWGAIRAQAALVRTLVDAV